MVELIRNFSNKPFWHKLFLCSGQTKPPFNFWSYAKSQLTLRLKSCCDLSPVFATLQLPQFVLCVVGLSIVWSSRQFTPQCHQQQPSASSKFIHHHLAQIVYENILNNYQGKLFHHNADKRLVVRPVLAYVAGWWTSYKLKNNACLQVVVLPLVKGH